MKMLYNSKVVRPEKGHITLLYNCHLSIKISCRQSIHFDIKDTQILNCMYRKCSFDTLYMTY